MRGKVEESLMTTYNRGDFLRKGRNKKNDEKSKYYSNKSFDL